MKPKKKYIVVERWDCGIGEHNHMSESVAMACIEKQARKPSKETLSKQEIKRRNIRAAKNWVNGATQKAAGESIGVSAERCRNIIGEILRISRKPELFLPTEPKYDWARKSLPPEHRDHYMMRIDAVAKYWGL